MEQFFSSIAVKIAEYAVAPAGHWLSYSFYYNSNIENMMNKKEELQLAQDMVQRSVDAARTKGETIYSLVEKWLTDVESALQEVQQADVRISNASLLNLELRHQLSWEAEKIVENIAELLEKGKNFNNEVSYLPPLQEMVTPRNINYMTFDSRISIMNRIMKALGDANIRTIVVWGLPGVGKSTLVKEIFKIAKEESFFHEVALVNVTDNQDVSQIQEEIGEMLGLKLGPRESRMARACRLQARLENDKGKKILVILDNIWEQLDLEEIGIIPSERCKVLLTSGFRQVLASEMVTEENSFKLDILGEQEAWKLFEKMAGDSIKDDHDLQNEAIKVAKACQGLPIALVTVSRALRKYKKLRIWKDALLQLTRTSKHDTEIWSPVYPSIELSYKHLVDEEVKSLFLLCARQGNCISYRDLLRYCFGLHSFHGIDTLEDASNRLEKLVSNLQDSCLLIQSPRSSKEFYMHDVVRHVATMIASNHDHNMFVMKGNGGQTAWPDAPKKCEALSIHGAEHIHKYPKKIKWPKLRYFHVQCEYLYLMRTPSSTSFQGMDKLEHIFFQGMDKLEVLSLGNMQLSSLLPLPNLQTLCLDGCKLGDIRWMGKLKTLVILSLARSDISNLPREIESLTRLKLLDLSYCFALKVILPNVLSSLVNLEEMYMQGIGVKWEVEGPINEGQNASLAELKKLLCLTTLEMDISDANNLPKDLFTEKLERYKICIGKNSRLRETLLQEEVFSRTLEFIRNMSFPLDSGIKKLLKRTEYLYLYESNSTERVLNELNREDFQKLKHLHIQNNGDIKHILELRTPAVAFPILETFVLKDMISLEKICQGNLTLASFKNLKVLKVDNCDKLRFIFSSSIARGLSLLEELNITRCNNMGAIFVKEEEDGIEDQGDMMLFGRLQTLVLNDLPKLVGFLSTKDSFMADCREETTSEGNHDLQLTLLHHDQVAFPSLQTLRLEHLPKIKHVWSEYSKTVFNFQNLKKIQAVRCESLKSLFPISVVSCLEQLQVLEIENCGVEEIVAVERGGEVVAIRTFEFSRVSALKLRNLPRLKWFYKGVHVSKWPMLKDMTIQRCHKVEIFASEVVSFEKAVEDQRQSEMSNIKQPLFSVDEHSFPSLEKLEISNMDSLEIIFGELEGQNGKEPQFFISSRSRTEESGAITNFASTVSFPSLETLVMMDLPKLKHVCSEYSKIVFNFQNLQKIYASKCESLKSLFPISVVSCLKQLQALELKECGVEEIVAVGGGGEAVAVRTLVFPRVSTLRFRYLPRLKWFYKGVHVSKWPMLKEMEIDNCKKVEIFASEVVSFGKTVEDQSQSEMSNIKQPLFSVDELSFSSLKKLNIWSMDRLEIIWQGQVIATSIPNIQELSIFGCDKLLHVFQSNLHTTTTTLMQSLTSLCIGYCDSLETIFGNMEGQNGKESQVLIAPSSGTEESVAREDGSIARHIEFPILTQLSLDGLPKLKWIFEGVHTNLESWPSLKILSLVECGEQVNKMIWASKFASSSSSQENQLPTCIQQPMFVVEEGTFPNLEDLSLHFSGRTIRPSRFSDFPDPSSLLTGLPNLLKLNVYDSVWEEIFPYELVDREIRLRRLTLCRLRMLIHLWKEDGTQPGPLFHNLEYLDVSGCNKLKNLVPSSVSLHNLTGLKISDCHGLINLLTSSTAKTLVQLERMTVIDCKRITEIVAMEDGEANVAITFNKLRCLELRGLPNLTHFCSGHYSFGFPSLDEVIVRCCPEMKTFSHGVLSTPKLTAVYDDRNRWNSKRNLHWEDDLNTTTRYLWKSNQYDTQCLFRERVENFEEDEDHSENSKEDEDHPSSPGGYSENSSEEEDHPLEDEDHYENSLEDEYYPT